ncbi:hypothetical protein FHG87_010689 [Trinorchestia longiramus]|nr:hypothetical protein FHG87_010689 [Trinorchestia longiramus]
MALVLVGAFAISSSDVFDSSTNNQWADDMCPSNTTCSENAKECFSQLRRARWFLDIISSYSNSLDSLAQRCQRKRDNFDACAAQANLNTTWSSITGPSLPCEHYFLRRLFPSHYRPHRFRPRRSRSRFSLPGHIYHERFESPFGRSVWDVRRREHRGGGRRGPWPSFFDRRGEWSRVKDFLKTLEQTNLAAFQNFTQCTLVQENLLTDTGDVDRATFETLASFAFAGEAQVLTDVRDAIQTCPEPTLPQLEDYMKCWATACVTTKLA